MLICNSQIYVELNKYEQESGIIINNYNEFVFKNIVNGFYVSELKAGGEIFNRVFVNGYYPDNNVGFPELPVMSKLIELPADAEIKVEILKYSEKVIDLKEFGIYTSIIPNQPSLRKDIDPSKVKFEKSKIIYNKKEFYSTNLVKVEKLGKMRGVQIAQLMLSPFSYDVESNTLTIIDNVEIRMEFVNADISKSLHTKKTKYSPLFEQSHKQLWNYKSSLTKDALSKYPIKYVIISDRMFENALQPFIEWKTKKGFNVITAYTDVIGNTTASIKTYLQGLYDSGNEANPAPTYLLIVGDVEQVPSFNTGTHVSDMYYCEFDGNGDYIPEMYFGRFSATTVEQLLPQIEKTLMFEQYTFPDDSFLKNALLVAGVDNTYSHVYCNGQVNYAANYYFNEDHGVNTSAYLHPESGGKLTEIITKINNGTGFVNYSAHCVASGWSNPKFYSSEVSGLTNEDQYFYSVGNCCLSNKFNNAECFGEALLRANKKGAVIHIGGSNNTYWSEDFYWSVGLTNNPTSNPTYEGTDPGVYDHLFHENGEVPYVTSGQMNYLGNMSVMASTSTRKKYYWEIYHVMGDPSLMPYVGVPSQLDADHNTVIPVGMPFIDVYTEPNAYAAISIGGVLIDAKISDSEGVLRFELGALTDGTYVDIVITKQFRIPYFGSVSITSSNNNNDVMLRKINTPTQVMHVSQSIFAPSFNILNIGNLNLESAVVGYKINEEPSFEIIWQGNLETFDTISVELPQITLQDGVYSFIAYADLPNGLEDENNNNNRIQRTLSIYSGNVSIINTLAPLPINCNVSELVPEIVIKNFDIYPLTSLKCSFECSGITMSIDWTGNIAYNETVNIQFPASAFPNGRHTINFSISEPNGGTNISRNIQSSAVFNIAHVGNSLELDFLTDNYGHENRWELIDLSTNEILHSDGSFPNYTITHNVYDLCLISGCYKFTVYDLYGDGMRGTSIGSNPPGAVIIKNKDSGNILLNLDGANPDFKLKYSFDFCLNPTDVVCPVDVTYGLRDELICLTNGLPQGGIYTGTQIIDGCFNPSQLGEGIYPVTYTYSFDGEEKSCIINVIVSLTSVESYSQNNSKIDIYPNPTNRIVNIKSLIEENFDIEVLNVFGQVVYKENNITNKIELDLSSFSQGTYFIKIHSGTDIVNKKISLLK